MKNSQDRKPVRSYGVYTATSKHSVNLRRNPTLHFQVGLILALLASLFFVEMRMPEQKAVVNERTYDDEDFMWSEVVQVEKVVVEQPKQPKQATPPQQMPEDFTVIDDDPTFIDDPVDVSDPDDTNTIVDPNDVDIYDAVDPVEDVPFVMIEEVPLFPGCEGLETNEERKACMSEKITKHVSRKFNPEVGEGLGIEGKNRIFVMFTVDKTGAVTDIKSRAPHVKLEKEAERVVKLLPKMEPGKQRKVPVGVVYTLPITLDIKD